jgi:hypothetical protein
LIAKFGKSYVQLPFERPHELLNILNSILASFDPDVIHTYFGDGLFPLTGIIKETGIPFNPNRCIHAGFCGAKKSPSTMVIHIIALRYLAGAGVDVQTVIQ